MKEIQSEPWSQNNPSILSLPCCKFEAEGPITVMKLEVTEWLASEHMNSERPELPVEYWDTVVEAGSEDMESAARG